MNHTSGQNFINFITGNRCSSVKLFIPHYYSICLGPLFTGGQQSCISYQILMTLCCDSCSQTPDSITYSGLKLKQSKDEEMQRTQGDMSSDKFKLNQHRRPLRLILKPVVLRNYHDKWGPRGLLPTTITPFSPFLPPYSYKTLRIVPQRLAQVYTKVCNFRLKNQIKKGGTSIQAVSWMSSVIDSNPNWRHKITQTWSADVII